MQITTRDHQPASLRAQKAVRSSSRLENFTRAGRKAIATMLLSASRALVPMQDKPIRGSERERLFAAARQIELAAERIRSEFSITSHEQRMAWATLLSDFMRWTRGTIDPLLFPPLADGAGAGFDWLEGDARHQTLTFYTDIWQVVFEEAQKLNKTDLRLLDVGCGCGIGAQLLAIVLRDRFGYPFRIFANDWQENFAPYARAHYDLIEFIDGPVGAIQAKFDFVICSHLIEHFEDPFPFVAELRERAIQSVILYAPFREKPLLNGHLYSFDEADLARMGVRSYSIVSSKAWPGKCFVAILDGTGEN